MNERTEEEVANAILANAALGRDWGAVDKLREDYIFFRKEGNYSPIAAAVLSQRSRDYVGAREDLIKLSETFVGLGKKAGNS